MRFPVVRQRRLLVLPALFVLLLTSGPHGAESDEVRALWVTRTSLTSPQSISTMVRTARANGFNTLLVQVRGRGDAYYDSTVEPRAAALALQPATFDPLQETLSLARQLGLRVHAWINVNLISSASELPSSREHVVYRRPEWLMVPRPLAAEMVLVPPQSPAYLGKLARWARSHNTEVEGLYLSPLQPAAAGHTVSVVSEIVSRYAVDGVHLDYVRYPTADFDVSAAALAEFRTEVVRDLSADERRTLDALAEVDLLAYVDAFPERWNAFRRSRLTGLVRRLRTVVKRERPEALLTAAVVPDPVEASQQRLQDWRTWMDTGLLDVVCPMAYATDAEAFAQQIAAARRVVSENALWIGIGAYRLSPMMTIDHIRTARRLGTAGIALFSYDSLTNPAQYGPDYLPTVARAVFGDHDTATAGGR
jgi:uncharacterized lipoprotein YddW (UPF0748 family)